jgi:hypothetical protein
MSEQEEIAVMTALCEEVQRLLQVATHGLKPPSGSSETPRRKMSVFTYGICLALARREQQEPAALYLEYLLQGGLSASAAQTVVERTTLKFMYTEYGPTCCQAGERFVQSEDASAVATILLS